MTEDNSAEWAAPKSRMRAFARAISHCLVSACLMEGRKKVVGAAFERAKASMSDEEREAIRQSTGADHHKLRPPI